MILGACQLPMLGKCPVDVYGPVLGTGRVSCGELGLGELDVANSLGWADGNELLGNSIPLSAGSLRNEFLQGVQALLLARGSFVPILPGLGVSLIAFPDQRLGLAYKGTRCPNGRWIAGTSLGVFLLWRSFSGQCYVHLKLGEHRRSRKQEAKPSGLG